MGNIMNPKVVMPLHTLTRFKPFAQIDSLIHHFLPHAEIEHFSANRLLHLDRKGERACLILLEGLVDISRIDDGILKGTLKAPFVAGISHPDYMGNAFHLMSATAVKVAILPYKSAMTIIGEQKLWEDYSNYLLYIMGLHSTLSNHSIGLRSRDIIRDCLFDLMNENEQYRLKTNACKYIIEKTALSRSGVMGILADMKKENIIGIQRGVLIFINDEQNSHRND